MSLPDLIEILPLPSPVRAEITVPGSKSITNRALVLAALAEGRVTLHGALWSEDTQIMVECLKTLGYAVLVEPDAAEECNRHITVTGQGGAVPPGGTRADPRELFVGNAGTVARFLTALVCLGQGYYRLRGVERMHQRPQAELIQALRQMGYQVESPDDRLPAVIQGGSQPLQSECRTATRGGLSHISIAESSQFASALLLCAHRGHWDIEVIGPHIEDSPYVLMTQQMCRVFPHRGGEFGIEPDASSGSYFWAADEIQRLRFGVAHGISVARWPNSQWQIDAEFPRFLPLPNTISRSRDLADSIMTAAVLAPWASAPVRFTDLGRLRVQECERVVALRAELTRCGIRVEERGDTLEVFPGQIRGAIVETYRDHRMAMCFALLGLVVPGIQIKNPACVKKTFPNFFQKLAAPPPQGLGITLLDAQTRQPLATKRLFAD